MSYNVWKPTGIYDTKGKYLYHFTKLDSAYKILIGDSFRFSSLNNTNDTAEAKLKLIYPPRKNDTFHQYAEKVKKVSEYFENNKQVLRLLCFSMDIEIGEEELGEISSKLSGKDKYYDVSGRGFALPRMWAQYASDNEGICFILNKEKLLRKVKDQIAVYKEGPVLYKRFFDGYRMTENQFNSLYAKVSQMANGGLTLLSLVINDDNFMKYNFFEKSDDWQNEHEYRIVAVSLEEKILEIKGIFSCMEGIVVGEKIEPAAEKIIRMLVDEKNGDQYDCEVKKIIFGNQICKIK